MTSPNCPTCNGTNRVYTLISPDDYIDDICTRCAEREDEEKEMLLELSNDENISADEQLAKLELYQLAPKLAKIVI